MKNDNVDPAANTAPENTEAQAPAVTEPTAAAPEPTAPQASEAETAVTAERKRVSDIMGLMLPGYEEMRDGAIQSGSSAVSFQTMMLEAEKAKRTERAEAVKTDTEANAAVAPSTGKEAAKGEDAAVNTILGAYKLATGEN